MREVFLCFIEVFFIVAALSVDAFVASVSYGTNGIKIPFISAIIIAVVSTGMLLLSTFLGTAVAPFFPPYVAKWIGFGVLLLLGVTKLFDSFIKAFFKKLSALDNGKKLKITLFNITFFLQIFADCKNADLDRSQKLSAGEAAALSIALSLDSLAAGFGVGVSSFPLVTGGITAFALTFVAVYGGFIIGKKLLNKAPFDISFLGGILLIVLAFFRL